MQSYVSNREAFVIIHQKGEMTISIALHVVRHAKDTNQKSKGARIVELD